MSEFTSVSLKATYYHVYHSVLVNSIALLKETTIYMYNHFSLSWLGYWVSGREDASRSVE